MTLVISKGITLAKGFTWNETIWNPSMLDTAVWLDGADASTITQSSGAVSQWADKSGKGRNAIQATSEKRALYNPVGLNSKGLLTFDGSSDSMSCTLSLDQPASLLCVANTNVTTGSTGSRQYVIDGVGGDGFTGRWILTLRGNQVNRPSIWAGTAFTPHTASTSAAFSIYEATYNGASSVVGINAMRVADLSPGTNNLAGLRLGANFADNGDFLNGSICEIVLVSNLQATNRQRLEGYLAHKWGLTASLPNDHPYKLTGPVP
jgi:hypothetical protein